MKHFIKTYLLLALISIGLVWGVQPKSPTVEIVEEVILGADSGARSPGTMADDATVGTRTWTNPTNIASSNDSYATASGGITVNYSHYLKATNFSFTIPSGATINGIVAEFERKWSGFPPGPFDNEIKIVKSDATIGATNRSAGATWSMTESYVSFGSSSDLWGETWDDTKINDVDFGVVISAGFNGDGDTCTAYVDHIRITVYYTESGGTPAVQTMSPSVIMFD